MQVNRDRFQKLTLSKSRFILRAFTDFFAKTFSKKYIFSVDKARVCRIISQKENKTR